MEKFTIVSIIQLDITMLNHKKGMNCLHNNFLSLKVFCKSGNSIQLDIVLVGWAYNSQHEGIWMGGGGGILADFWEK